MIITLQKYENGEQVKITCTWWKIMGNYMCFEVGEDMLAYSMRQYYIVGVEYED